MSDRTNWSLLAALRMWLAFVVAGGHLLWYRKDNLSEGFALFDGKAAVIGFLLVSGYSIAASLDRDASGFYFRRFKRIYPVYFVSVAAAIALEFWLGTYSVPGYTFQALGPVAAIGNLLMLQTFLVKSIAFNGVVWSLAVECAFYVVSPALKRMSMMLLLAGAAVSAVFYLLPQINDAPLLYVLATKFNAAKYFWPFALGFLLYYYRSGFLAVALCAAGCGLAWSVEIYSLAVVTVAASFCILLLARRGVGKPSQALDYLGDLSYPLYLVHLPTYIVCYKLLGWTAPWLLLSIAMLVTVATYELIDVRLKRFLFGRSKSFRDLFTLKVAGTHRPVERGPA